MKCQTRKPFISNHSKVLVFFFLFFFLFYSYPLFYSYIHYIPLDDIINYSDEHVLNVFLKKNQLAYKTRGVTSLKRFSALKFNNN